MREKYESLALADFKEIAKSRGINGTSAMKKSEVVESMLLLDEKEKEAKAEAVVQPAEDKAAVRNNEPKEINKELDSGITANGIIEVLPDGYGFIRCENYMPGENDVYVAPSQIRRFNLKTGDIVCGNTRVKTQAEKFSALLYVKSVNGMDPDVAARRVNFEDMTLLQIQMDFRHKLYRDHQVPVFQGLLFHLIQMLPPEHRIQGLSHMS